MREALYIKINKIVIYNLILNEKKKTQSKFGSGPKLTPPSVPEKSKFQKADIPTAPFCQPV